jgi:hypothetical protein
MEELPNCRHLGDNRPTRGFPRELPPTGCGDPVWTLGDDPDIQRGWLNPDRQLFG